MPSTTEIRHIVIYGYTRQELKGVLMHFEKELPVYVTMSLYTKHEFARITLTGSGERIELLRFNMNKLQQMLANLFTEEVLSYEEDTLAEILGKKLSENELTVSAAESCTGGNIAHRIVQVSGSSAYFLGSVVSYSNDVKTSVLKVDRTLIEKYGAVSQQVVEAMANGVCTLMRTDCAIATSGIAGPGGGTAVKPVGTVWIAAKYQNLTVSECKQFQGDRNSVIEAATNHGIAMLIKLLRDHYTASEEPGDE